MVAIRADQQIAVSIVRPVEIDVMNVLVTFQRTTESALRDLDVNSFGARPLQCLAVDDDGAPLRAIDVPAGTDSMTRFSARDVRAFFAMFGRRQFQFSALTWIQRLSFLVAWQANVFRFLVVSFVAFLESRTSTCFSEPIRLFAFHAATTKFRDSRLRSAAFGTWNPRTWHQCSCEVSIA